MPIEIAQGPGALPLIRVSTPESSGEIFLHGAQIASWVPDGHRPVLWMSSRSRFARAEPIRGGVPICFPWFSNLASDQTAPQHGFARLQEWELVEAEEVAGIAVVVLRLTDSAESRASAWPHRFEAFYRVTMGAELTATLEVVNRDEQAFTFEQALHSYFAVVDVHTTEITGLEQLPYLEKGSETIARDSGPLAGRPMLSRRYTGVTNATIEDRGNQRSIIVRSSGARGAVVWNPGPEIAAGMDDFDSEAWPTMLCLENCNIDQGAVRLSPGERHAMHVSVAVRATNPERLA